MGLHTYASRMVCFWMKYSSLDIWLCVSSPKWIPRRLIGMEPRKNSLDILFTLRAGSYEELVPFRCYAAGILSCKYKAKGSVIKEVKAILKRILTKRINVFQTIGVDENSMYTGTFFHHDVEQLTSRVSIEIAH
jgi:hypothetical protein